MNWLAFISVLAFVASGITYIVLSFWTAIKLADKAGGIESLAGWIVYLGVVFTMLIGLPVGIAAGLNSP